MKQTHNMQETSLDAYLDILTKVSERHQIILAAFLKLGKTYGDATDFEVAKFLNKSDPNFVRPRRFELVKMKAIEQSQKRECKITGKMAIAWRLR